MVRFTQENGTIVIYLPATVDYTVQKHFRSIYARDQGEHQFVVDFSEVTLLQSSGVALLLMLREHCERFKRRVSLVNVSSRNRAVLETALLNDKFDF
ncbi:MAG: STAS domain-containing protein [Magnetococcus sp. WYHC-3]